MSRITVIGGGRIGEALIAGLLEAGHRASDLVVVEASDARADELARRYAIGTCDLDRACDGSDVVVVAVKPGAVPDVVGSVAEVVAESVRETVVVSVAAGVPIGVLEGRLGAGTPVLRVMPNTPMLVGRGTSAVAPGRFAREEHVRMVVGMMESVGTAVVVSESQMDAVTAVSGSGPAYFFLLAEAMVDAGVAAGLPRPVAQQLVLGTAAGAGAMLAADGADAVELRSGVTSPGGTTAAGVRALETGGLRAAVYGAVEAAAGRSVELAQEAVDSERDRPED